MASVLQTDEKGLRSVAEADEAKLKAAIAYLVERTTPGKLKLFKLLYLADFEAYVRLGRSITDETYEHWENGPVPRTLWRRFQELIRQCADIELVEWGMPFPEQQMRPKPGLDLSAALSPEERAILDDIIRQYGSWSGAALRDLTHRDIPYLATSRGEEIPYYLAPYRHFKTPTEEERARVVADQGLRATLRQLLPLVSLRKSAAR